MDKKDIKYQFEGKNLSDSDKTWGHDRFENYLISYPHLNQNLGNSQLLEELVWAEIMLEKMKAAIAKHCEQKGDNSPVPPSDKEQKSLQEAREQVLNLKRELGMFEEKKNQDAYEMLQTLFAKHDAYIESHMPDYTTCCPGCGLTFVQRYTTKDYTPCKTAFYENKILNNKVIMEWYHMGRITKEEAAKAHEVPARYIDWLDAKFYGKKIVEDGGTNMTDPETPSPQQ